MASVETGTRIVAALSIIFCVIGAAIGIYFARNALPFVIWLIESGGGLLAVLVIISFSEGCLLVICGLIFVVLTIWATRFPIKRRKWFKYIGIAGLVLVFVLVLLNFGHIVAGAPVAVGAAIDLIAWWYAGKGQH